MNGRGVWAHAHGLRPHEKMRELVGGQRGELRFIGHLLCVDSLTLVISFTVTLWIGGILPTIQMRKLRLIYAGELGQVAQLRQELMLCSCEVPAPSTLLSERPSGQSRDRLLPGPSPSRPASSDHKEAFALGKW